MCKISQKHAQCNRKISQKHAKCTRKISHKHAEYTCKIYLKHATPNTQNISEKCQAYNKQYLSNMLCVCAQNHTKNAFWTRDYCVTLVFSQTYVYNHKLDHSLSVNQ